MATLAYGYVVTEKGRSESYDSNGARATVTYLGPWESRFDFLDLIFGRWITREVDGTCCIDGLNTIYPTPYASWNSLVLANVAGQDQVNISRNCLWPDSFSIAIEGDPTSRPAVVCYDQYDEENPEAPPVTLCDPPGTTKQSSLYNLHGGCTAEITVNYVAKDTNEVPIDFMCGCGAQNLAIELPRGVFVDVSYSPGIESISVPGRAFQFDNNYYSNRSLVITPNDACNKVVNGQNVDQLQIPDEISDVMTIDTGQIDMKLSNVPFALTENLRRYNGSTNAAGFLGFPIGSLALTVGTPTKRKTHRCSNVYDIDLSFLVRMVTFTLDQDKALWQDTGIALGIVCNKMGIWNKRWRSCPISIKVSDGDDFCTHWQEIVSSVACEGDEQKVLPYVNWYDPADEESNIFYIPYCGQAEYAIRYLDS